MKLPKMRLARGEVILFSLRTHPKVLFLKVVSGIILLALTITYAINFAQMHEIIHYIVYGTLMIAGLYFCIVPIFQWLNRKYVITNRQLFITEGILMKRTHSSQLGRASDTNVERGILDRIFNCGTLIVLNASSDLGSAQTTMVMKDIPGVLDVEERIKEMVYEMNHS